MRYFLSDRLASAPGYETVPTFRSYRVYPCLTSMCLLRQLRSATFRQRWLTAEGQYDRSRVLVRPWVE